MGVVDQTGTWHAVAEGWGCESRMVEASDVISEHFHEKRRKITRSADEVVHPGEVLDLELGSMSIFASNM